MRHGFAVSLKLPIGKTPHPLVRHAAECRPEELGTHLFLAVVRSNKEKVRHRGILGAERHV